MSSVGVFRKVDLDDKSYWVYTLTQSDNPVVSTTSFLCPAARIRFLKDKIDGDDHPFYFHNPVDSPPHFPNRRTDDQQDGSLLDCDKDYICKLPVVPLFQLFDEEFTCGACQDSRLSTSYYECRQCQMKFHKECVESPLEIKHPSHPFHSLILNLNRSMLRIECTCCGIESRLLYHCTTCDLSMHPICTMRTIPFVEDHPKSHPHPLSFFPTQASLVCHICGQIKNLDPTYICIQCTFVIHKGCIGFPHLIRISRHHHRIAFTPSLPPGKLLCRVCHKDIDNNYGAYSCRKCEDAYFVHTKCALNPKVWDGIDLEGVPEEDDAIDDGEPFQRIADGIILHPFHSHNMRLKTFKAYDEKKFCRGCSLPIYEGQFYSCMDMECDFILHESCAHAPRMKRHPLHPHPLTLKVAAGEKKGTFRCTVCDRYGTGFFYEHRIRSTTFQLDLRCASITEPFEYQGHQHPLFLSLDPEEEPKCQTCDYGIEDWKLRCIECNYVICIRCTTFPYKARYKHDDHFLTIRDGKKASDQVEWCEICEGKIEKVKHRGYFGERKKELRFYRCDDCSTALHVECLLGVDMNIKPYGNTEHDYIYYQRFSHSGWKIGWIHLNSSLSRPICGVCRQRCRFPIVVEGDNNRTFCSCDCLY